MAADDALEATYDVLVIDDVCSFLTPRLVLRLREQGKDILGVISPQDGPDAKRRLLECGVTDVIESDARPDEFLRILAATRVDRLNEVSTASRGAGRVSYRVGVRSAATGSGATEVAIAIASRLGAAQPTVLIDLDQQHPGVALRLDLPVYPNLRTAVDLAHHDPDRLPEALLDVSGLLVAAGLSAGVSQDPYRTGELTGLVEELGSVRRIQVMDMGESVEARGIACDVEITVGDGSPVGVARLIRTFQDNTPIGAERVVVVNRAPSGRRSDEIKIEMGRALDGVAVVVIPEDDHVRRAAWDGTLVTAGKFAKGMARIADLLLAAAPT
jgi:MinD-like ATPase involved in chromosome partitioning or flagellar assembly